MQIINYYQYLCTKYLRLYVYFINSYYLSLIVITRYPLILKKLRENGTETPFFSTEKQNMFSALL